MADKYIATEIYIRWNDHEYEINTLGSYETEIEAIEAVLKIAVYDYMTILEDNKDTVYKEYVKQIHDTDPTKRIDMLRDICHKRIQCYAYPQFYNWETQWVWKIQKIN